MKPIDFLVIDMNYLKKYNKPLISKIIENIWFRSKKVNKLAKRRTNTSKPDKNEGRIKNKKMLNRFGIVEVYY